MGVVAFKKANVMEPAVLEPPVWLMNEMTVMGDGLGTVTSQPERAQPRPKPRGGTIVKKPALDVGPQGGF